jgi:hypothetical protein
MCVGANDKMYPLPEPDAMTPLSFDPDIELLQTPNDPLLQNLASFLYNKY